MNELTVKELTIVKETARKHLVMDGEKYITGIQKIFEPGSGKIIDGKLMVTANFIGILEKGMSITEINLKYQRQFYNLYIASDETIIIANDLNEALEFANGKGIEVEETVEDVENDVPTLPHVTVEGKTKYRLKKSEKEAFKEKFNAEIKNSVAFRKIKTVKEQVIYLHEQKYPTSAIAFVLDKRFQQVRGYLIDYLGMNLKDLK